MSRIYLSPPHMGSAELELVRDAFASNWIAPLGPYVAAFEKAMCEQTTANHAVALSSGTAALHLALRVLGVGAGDEVICSTLTFAASANVIRYVGATPVFVDACPQTWTLDPALLHEELADRARRGAKLPRAAIVVDLYGQCADYDEIGAMCARYGVEVIEDAAESLGSTYRSKPAGSFGRVAAVSFNGNKIITTSGGGMLLTPDAKLAEQSVFLATQARDPAPHYQHSQLGYNYRLSNLLAAIGCAQLAVLPQRVASRRAVFERYRHELENHPGIAFMPEAPYGDTNRWLTVLTIDPRALGVGPDAIRQHLAEADIESRPVWKPMHLQPLYSDCRVVGGSVSEGLFARGLCLPSGSSLTPNDVDRVIERVLTTPGIQVE